MKKSAYVLFWWTLINMSRLELVMIQRILKMYLTNCLILLSFRRIFDPTYYYYYDYYFTQVDLFKQTRQPEVIFVIY